MSKLLIVDKDQTIIRSRLGGREFVRRPWDQVPIPGVLGTLEKYREDGWKIVIASNQGGIAAGKKTLESTFMEMEFCLELFPMIDEAFFCPDYEGRHCWRMWRNDAGLNDEDHRILYDDDYLYEKRNLSGSFRKPKGGMLVLADDLFPSDKAFFIGDMETDRQAAIDAGIGFKWSMAICTE